MKSESSLIKRIRQMQETRNPSVIVGIGDDAAVIKEGDGFLLYSTDCLVEGVHFRRKWFTPEQIGSKAIEVNVSDIFAMGGAPEYILVNLILPASLPFKYIEKVYSGMKKSMKRYSIDMIGGNISRGREFSLTVFIRGRCRKQPLTLRSSARPGDLIMVSRPIGSAKAGLRAMEERLKGHESAKKSYLAPRADAAGAANAKYATAMIDITDGLSADLRHICVSSEVGAVIHKGKIPVARAARTIASLLHEDPLKYALSGGDDLALLYTVPEKELSSAKGFVIGEIINGNSLYLAEKGEQRPLTAEGYDHFQKWLRT